MSQPLTKDSSRSDRLSISYSHKAEHVLRSQFGAAALKKCSPFITTFGDCAKKEGVLVVFKCRGENNRMNECLREWNSDEKFEEFKQARAREILKGGG